MNDKCIDFDLRGKRIWVAGHTGMVGSAVMRHLEAEPCELITATRNELDLIDQKAVYAWLKNYKPDAIILAAAKVGGILENNDYPYQFLMENLQIQNNLIDGAFRLGVEKFIFLGSSCIYPQLSKQPITE